jgi:Fe-S-cluster containining protein
MSMPVLPKPPRSKVPSDASLCDYCTAKCCKYFALPIETPTEQKDFDYMRWFLLHDRASVFVEDDTWYLLVHTTCKHLQSNNLCGIYHTRPQICRDYSTDNCEYEDSWTYEKYFESPEQVVEYVEATLGAKDRTNIRSSEPPILPILSSV